MRIDAHQHFWQLAARHGAWPPPALAAIYRDFAPPDLTPLLAAHGIDALPDRAGG
jgi:L-fuconolactonase